MAGLLAGRRALVTGAGRGIGAGIARRLAAEGAAVIVCDIDAEPAQRVACEIGGRALAFDVADADAAGAAIRGAGPLDALVCNAGFDDFDYFTDTTPARWRRLLAVNVEGVLACTHAALDAMYAAGYGRIVTVASEAGRIGSRGNAVYAASKGAVIAFSKSLAREGARYGVTVNCVCPGPVDTPLLQANRRFGARGERMIEAMREGTLLGRLGTPDEVAAMVVFLACEQSSFVTGETIGVSGGMGVGA